MTTPYPIDAIRARFPGLARTTATGVPAIFLDGPAGSQVPTIVAEAVRHHLLHDNANVGGAFATSRATGAAFDGARAAMCDWFGSSGDPDEIVFGPNMTSLTYAFSRALAKTWRAGDEVVVTRLDHDANVTPWVQAAAHAGATVRHVDVRADDATLDLEALHAALGPKTKLVAVTAASNLVGSKPPIREIADAAHAHGAVVWVDAVHFAAHELLDVAAWDCDFCVCSAYKFYGPHVGIVWGRRALLAELPVDRLRPVADETPGRWMNGTPNLEGIAGTRAAVDYVADLGRELDGNLDGGDRRSALRTAFAAIHAHETALCRRLLDALAGHQDTLRVVGITDGNRLDDRAPTVAVRPTHADPKTVERALAEHGVFVWSGHSYAVPLTTALDLEPAGVVRLGLLHYNTADEVDRAAAALLEVIGSTAN